VQIDLAWLQRLDALVEIGHRTIMLLASLFAIAILLIVGNTLRLTIFNRRKEILVTKLIGGTGAFIRRPFLYIGFWYGLFGAILAWIVVESLLFLLHGPIEQLTNLYHSQFDFETLTLSNSLLLFAGSVTLGITGSWLAVMRHLKTIEPS
jgi:cell division transport system permease protein